MESASGMCFLELYVKSILALGVSAVDAAFASWNTGMLLLHTLLTHVLAPPLPPPPHVVASPLLHAPQAKAGRALPLAIMTSDDTHQRTVDLLEKHSHWGAAPGQVGRGQDWCVGGIGCGVGQAPC